ncbi:gp436 family protein [Thalassococcus sp. S3]|uniref:gp436 family protein n=1 Tax=Thalassococcus sp. S3 TaxID=2017482 RepID=UPI00102475FD|nr:DUF1320 domain-containing protein [Thalassococcus sp. S3]QBF31497.1 hypothetical protein CFI11_09750 [Thalassococcus sp. S3]
MTYTTQADLETRYGTRELVRLTDRGEVATDQIDPAPVAAAIVDAAALIDGYLAKRYALPMASVPPIIKGLTEVIAYYNLHGSTPDEKADKDHDRALKKLEDIKDGVIALPIAGVTPEPTGDTGAKLTDRERPMTADSLKGFI